ncbi:MAG: PAS domain S-box protein [Flavihumibacter sp.]
MFPTQPATLDNKHHSETSLRESEERYRDLFENAIDIIYIIDMAGAIVSINRKAGELLGYTEKELLGKSAHLLVAPERLQEMIVQEERKKSGQADITVYESEYITREGKKLPVEISSRLIYRDGVAAGTHVTARDISRQRQAQQARVKSEWMYRFLSEHARDLIGLHLPDTQYVYVSSSVRSMLGYEPEELVGRWPHEFYHPDDAGFVNQEVARAMMERRRPSVLRYRFLHKGGHYIWLETVPQPIIDQGEMIYVQTISRDITERKIAEQQLVEKDRLSSALANTSRLLLLDQPLDQLLLRCIPLFCDALQADRMFVVRFEEGKVTDTLLWNGPSGTFLKNDPSMQDAALFTATQLAEYHIEQEQHQQRLLWMQQHRYQSLLVVPVFTSDGFWGSIGCVQQTAGRQWNENVRNSFITFASSISSMLENHLREKQLRQSEEWFRTLFRSSLDIVFVVDAKGRLGYATPSLETILGYGQSDLLGEYCRQIVHPENAAAFNQVIDKLAGNTAQEQVLPLRIKHARGHWCWMELKGQSRLHDPNIKGIVLSLRDIGEYIEIENTLKQYGDRITGVLRSITDGFISTDRDLRITMFNTVAAEALNDSPRLALGENIWDLLPNARESDSYFYLNLAIAENKTTRYEQWVESLNRWFDISAFPFEGGLFIYFRDSTEKKFQEGLLQLEKELLELNAASTPTVFSMGYVLLERLEVLLRGTHTAMRLVKTSTQEALPLASYGLPDNYGEFVKVSQLDPRLSTAGTAVGTREAAGIADIARSNLHPFAKECAAMAGIRGVWSTPLISSANEVLCVFTFYFTESREPRPEEIMAVNRALRIFAIVLENRQAAEKLHISNERYILATRAANEAIWDWDAEEQVSYWGEGFKTIFGYTSEFYPGRSMHWENKIHPDDRDRVITKINKFITGKRKGLFTEEYRFLKADGNYAYVHDKAYCLYNDEGKVIRMIGSCEDITETKRLQEQLLQQEIHKQQQIAQAVVDVQESERAEIGKELHDNVNQLLSTAKLFLEVAANDAACATDDQKSRTPLYTPSMRSGKSAGRSCRQVSATWG